MIKNYKQFNESLLSKLQGPSKDEVFKSFGYEKGFDTPKEFFLDVIKDIKVREQTKYPESVFWEKNGKVIFEQDFKKNLLYVDYKSIWMIFEKFYGLQYSETQLFIKNMVEEHLNWNRLTPNRGWYIYRYEVEEHLNWNRLTPFKRQRNSIGEVEEYLNWNGLTPYMVYATIINRWKNI